MESVGQALTSTLEKPKLDYMESYNRDFQRLQAKTIDDDLEELFQEIEAEAKKAEAESEAAARKRGIKKILECKTFDDICLTIASMPPPKRQMLDRRMSFVHAAIHEVCPMRRDH